MRLCDWRLDVLSMSSSAQWSWKRRAFSAIINCSAQEHETSSTTNADAVHCEKREGGCQSNTTFSVEYSREGLKFEGGEPSEGMVEARSAALWGHWVADVDRGAGLTVTGGRALTRVGETSPKGNTSKYHNTNHFLPTISHCLSPNLLLLSILLPFPTYICCYSHFSLPCNPCQHYHHGLNIPKTRSDYLQNNKMTLLGRFRIKIG